jgi:hybrid cluster-associated redox disulfide protein
MDERMIDLQWTVEKVFETWPQAFSVFMKHKTKCPGCFMQSFCTLKDVAEIHQLSLEDLIDELKNLSAEGN